MCRSATEYVDEMVAMIAELIASDHAYVTDDGVYMSVESVDDYGLRASIGRRHAIRWRRSRGRSAPRRSAIPADSRQVLWKFAKSAPTVATLSGRRPAGRRPPGWHSRVRR